MRRDLPAKLHKNENVKQTKNLFLLSLHHVVCCLFVRNYVVKSKDQQNFVQYILKHSAVWQMRWRFLRQILFKTWTLYSSISRSILAHKSQSWKLHTGNSMGRMIGLLKHKSPEIVHNNKVQIIMHSMRTLHSTGDTAATSWCEKRLRLTLFSNFPGLKIPDVNGNWGMNINARDKKLTLYKMSLINGIMRNYLSFRSLSGTQHCRARV